MAVYSIKDLEKLSGIQAHTIRIWEKRYKLVCPRRTDTNIRVYTDEDLKRLLNIAILNNNGIKISKIARLSDEEMKDRILSLTEDTGRNENQIDALVLSMVELNESKFEKVLSRLILQNGFEEAITHIIYPFLSKIGVLWQTGNINPAQEHFITNLIRQKLFVAIDSVLTDDLPDRKRFILFLPEGELHDIALLYYSYLIKKMGHEVIYLGQTVPFSDIVEVNKIKPCQYLVTSMTTPVPDDTLDEFLSDISKSFPEQKIFILSGQIGPNEVEKYPNITPIRHQTAFNEFLKSITSL
ncbi:MAG TPA: MerR family transcriptional regulator [Bacteroidales bacterium]|nr:MerR family transcriptional regulator [Bacteroidales bacterium]